MAPAALELKYSMDENGELVPLDITYMIIMK